MSQSVARSERILARLAEQTNLTAPAVEFLKVALDPFHDTPTNCTGIPNGTLGNSVVQCIKKSVTINAPPNVVTAGVTWDCHVKLLPFTSNDAQPLMFMNCRAQAKSNAVTLSTTTQPYRPVGPINIVCYPTGDSTEYSNSFQAGIATDSNHTTTNLFLDGNFSNGIYRVCGQGFEVLNTTATLYTQGMATCYRTPVPSLEVSNTITCFNQTDATTIKGQFAAPVLVIPGPPTSVNEALSLPNTKQWLAKEGCYVVGRFNDLSEHSLNNSYIQPWIQKGYDSTIEYGYMPEPKPTTTIGSYDILGSREIQWANMDISGAFFTGLHPNSTLTVNWNIYIERFPSRQEADLVVLAKPTPEYCPMALELYKAISMDLPVGVMQKENGLGDWFRDAVSTVSEIVSPVMSMIPHPVAQTIGKVAGVAGNLTRRESESPYVSEKAEKEFLKPIRRERVIERVPEKKKTVKKEIKKEIKKDLKHAVKPQHKEKAKRK